LWGSGVAKSGSFRGSPIFDPASGGQRVRPKTRSICRQIPLLQPVLNHNQLVGRLKRAPGPTFNGLAGAGAGPRLSRSSPWPSPRRVLDGLDRAPTWPGPGFDHPSRESQNGSLLRWPMGFNAIARAGGWPPRARVQRPPMVPTNAQQASFSRPGHGHSLRRPGHSHSPGLDMQGLKQDFPRPKRQISYPGPGHNHGQTLTKAILVNFTTIRSSLAHLRPPRRN